MSRAQISSGLLAATLLCLANFAQALPVIPGAAGFGMDTPAGRGGTVYRVTNLNSSGTGSLRACIDGATPRVCVFQVSGVIRLTSDLVVRNDKLTIAGQTAPSPGIMIRGAALQILASDVLVQHLRIRVGDDAAGPAPANRDALKITGSATRTVRNVVIDHCSFSWAVDETVSVWGPHDNITFKHNIFAEPLNDSIHPTDDGTGTEKHGFGVILGTAANSSITMVDNLFAHIVERNPLSRAAELVMVNNVVYNRGNLDLDVQSDVVATTKTTATNNLFIRGPSYARDSSPIYIRTGGSLTLGLGSRVYQSGNYSVDYVRELVTLTAGDTIPGLLATDHYPVWNGGLTVLSNSNNAMYDHVLAQAGARPMDRDTVDKRIISQVKARSGQIINCVASNGSTRCAKNGGGWPTLAANTRSLTLPANPNTVTASGYTNLELWLQSMDQTLAGITQATSPAAPSVLKVN